MKPTHQLRHFRPAHLALVIPLALTLPLLGALPWTSAGARLARPASAQLADSIPIVIEQLVTAEKGPAGIMDDDWRRIQRLYRAHAHAARWLESEGPSGVTWGVRAQALISAVTEAPSEGIRLDAYQLDAMRDALEASNARPSAESLAWVDVRLTALFVRYASDLLIGQLDPRTINRAWHIDPRGMDVDSAMLAALAREHFAETLDQLRPSEPDYAGLISAASRYQTIVRAGGWPMLPALVVLRPGDVASAGALGLLMARLHAEGYMALAPLTDALDASSGDSSGGLGPTAPVLYTKELGGVVAAYQRAHELRVDSVLGPQTLASLNQPADRRLRQIAANLERLRWMPHARTDRYVLVNIPAFRLRAFDGGREALTMEVVVGANYGGRNTPVFADSMTYVVFRPYWNVPESIASRELWPRQRQDADYFRRHGYEAVNASWGTYVRQKPAADNALGRAKFIFPNQFSIYLHDTPAQALFDEQVRAFSHGCIRVAFPDQLAAFVLGPQGWTIDQVRASMSSGRDNHRVLLEQKLPVYIVYLTAFLRDDAVRFARDIYALDDALMRAVGDAPLPSPNVLRAIEALRAQAGRPALTPLGSRGR